MNLKLGYVYETFTKVYLGSLYRINNEMVDEIITCIMIYEFFLQTY